MSESGIRDRGPLDMLRVVTDDEPSHPLARAIWNRPEVHAVERHTCPDHERYIVTFDGWAMPRSFPHDYGLAVDEFYVTDPRPLWKQVLGAGQRTRLEVTFTREYPDVFPDDFDSVAGGGA